MQSPIPYLILFLFLASKLQPQSTLPDSSGSASFFDLLASDATEILDLVIETDVNDLVRKKFQEEYLDGRLLLPATGGRIDTLQVELRARGNARKQICYFPPVKLKVKKKELTALGLTTDFNTYKIVNQCRSSRENEQYVIKEYLAYKLYNIVSPYSFRTRLLRLQYRDTIKEKRSVEVYGFIIEEVDELARRHLGEVIDREHFSTHMLESKPCHTMALFEYMIGNTDWAVGNLHNLELVKVPQHTKVLAIPYDFDYAGLVNTRYAVPAQKLSISDVTQRLYRGPACTEEEANELIRFFLEKETEIMETCEKMVLLEDKERQEILRYISGFFEELRSPRSLLSSLQKN